MTVPPPTLYLKTINWFYLILPVTKILWYRANIMTQILALRFVIPPVHQRSRSVTILQLLPHPHRLGACLTVQYTTTTSPLQQLLVCRLCLSLHLVPLVCIPIAAHVHPPIQTLTRLLCLFIFVIQSMYRIMSVIPLKQCLPITGLSATIELL